MTEQHIAQVHNNNGEIRPHMHNYFPGSALPHTVAVRKPTIFSKLSRLAKMGNRGGKRVCA